MKLLNDIARAFDAVCAVVFQLAGIVFTGLGVLVSFGLISMTIPAWAILFGIGLAYSARATQLARRLGWEDE